jgi:murein DD-endopeptidase MepM/ murein hydrolase activator NlpD
MMYVIYGSYSYGRSWPIEEVSHPACKSLHRDEHPDFCKLSLPTITQEDFQSSYKKSTVLQLIFSLPRKTPYTNNTELGKGSHPSLDIATSKGTPVYAIGNGKVISAGVISGYGNSITLKHQMGEQTLYSSYSHLDKILVRVGEKVSEKQLIGKVGNSGMFIGKYGNHLDFQISTPQSPAHPYGFAEFTGERYMDIVNQGLHQDVLEQYTLDPINFFTHTEASEESLRMTVAIQMNKAYARINVFFKSLVKNQ